MSGYYTPNTGVHSLTAVIYFVYFIIAIFFILLLCTWLIKGTMTIIIFFYQYWLQASIQIEGLGLLSLEQAIIVSKSERSVIIIDNLQLQVFDSLSHSFFKVYIEKFRLEHLSVLPTHQLHKPYR